MSHLYELYECTTLPNKNEIIIGGDFNINFISNNSHTSDLKKLLAKNKLHQIVSEPTLIAQNDSLLDLIITDSDCIKYHGVLDINISDHLSVFMLRKKDKIKYSKCEFSGRTYRNYNKDILSGKLNQYSWDELDNINHGWSTIINRITEILDEFCPIKSFSFKKDKQPWVNQELLTEMANRDEAVKVAERTDATEDEVYARKIRNRTKNLANKAQIDSYNNQLDANSGNQRKYWQHIFTILNKNKNDTKFNLEDDNFVVLDQSEVPNYINAFFYFNRN